MIIEVLLEVPKEVFDGLRTGEYIRKGGVIVTKDGHQIVAWLKDVKDIDSTAIAAINPTVAVAVLALAAGFFVICKKIDTIMCHINNIEQELQEIKETVEDINVFQQTSLIADFRAAVIWAERGDREKKNSLLEDARKIFSRIAEMSYLLTENIIKNNQLAKKYNLYTDLSYLYYASAQCDISCDRALGEFQTAHRDTERHLGNMLEMKNNFRNYFSSAKGNEIEILSYQDIMQVEEKYKNIIWYSDNIEGKKYEINYFKQYNIPYLEQEKAMMELHSNQKALLCIPKLT